MPTLLLRLVGPLQAWGTQSRFLIRDTGLEPSKSGVIGLICAALGKPRAEEPAHLERWPSLEQLSQLRMAVRVDRPGNLLLDYHTAGGSQRGDYGVAKANDAKAEPVVSQRHYLTDAAFLVGLEGTDYALLARIHRALAAPVWQLSLGRKACVPGEPVYLADGLRHQTLCEALSVYPLLISEPAHTAAAGDGEPTRLRLVRDADATESVEIRTDIPLDFAARRFTYRYVLVTTIQLQTGQQGGKADVPIAADS